MPDAEAAGGGAVGAVGGSNSGRRWLALLAVSLLVALGALFGAAALLLTPRPLLARLVLAGAGVHLAVSGALLVGVARRQRLLLLAGCCWLIVLTAAAVYSSCAAWPGCGWQLAASLLATAYLCLTLAAVLRYERELRSRRRQRPPAQQGVQQPLMTLHSDPGGAPAAPPPPHHPQQPAQKEHSLRIHTPD